MNQHLHLVTLGVRDFETSKKFYTETLGWKPSSASNEDVTFIQAGGIVLSIYPREKLAEDALVSPEGHGFAGITLAYNAQSESEVDKIISDLKAKGVKILKEPQKVFWGDTVPTLLTPMAIAGKLPTIPFFHLMKAAT